MKEQYLQIQSNIVRCSFSPGSSIQNIPCVVDAGYFNGTPCNGSAAPVTQVRFTPRKVFHALPEGKPMVKVIKTVDGQRTVIENLKSRFVRTSYRAEVSFTFAENERIFGLGQDEQGVFQKRGTIEYLYQHNMKIPMPIFVSSLGYAVLFDCACLMVFDDSASPCRVTLACVDQVDLYVITGSMDEIVAGYRTLTGRAAKMPPWVFGYWQSKERYETAQALLDVANRHRQDQVPLDVVVQDWKTWEGDLWGDKHLDAARYKDIKPVTEQLHAMHVHSAVSVWPNMNAGGSDHAAFAAHDWLLGDYSTYDAFDENARALYWQQMEQGLYQNGFDAWWCDSTEPFSSPDWCGEHKKSEQERYRLVGEEHEKYLDPAVANAYALVHAKGIYYNQPQKPVVNLTRSGWAGIQKYGAILWAGDTSASWDELRREIVKGMSLCMCGIPYWTVDTGAFFAGGTACWRKWKGDTNAEPVWFWHGQYDNGVKDKSYQELYTRWLQFSCFLPIFRSHGTDTPREYWQFEEPFQSAIIETIRLRYRLMPYITAMAERVSSAHDTMMRCLLFDFPDDPRAKDIENEFMFGRDILVCPVTEPILYPAVQNPVWRCYLPTGCDWTDFETGRVYPGGQEITVPVTISRIPVFVRAGAIIPLVEGLQYASE